jgi:hypothetical protein
MLLFEGDQKEERRLKPFFLMNFLHSMVEEMKTQRLCVYEHENYVSKSVFIDPAKQGKYILLWMTTELTNRRYCIPYRIGYFHSNLMFKMWQNLR